MKQIVIGMIGFGGMAHYHLHHIMPRENQFVVKGGYDVDPEKQAELESAGLVAFPNLEALLADSEIELVLIATPNDMHHDLAVAALRHGKNVLCEKPAMLSVAELEDVLDVANECQRHFFVHQNRRWDPDFLIVKAMKDQNLLGDIYKIESRVQGGNGIPGDWRHSKEHGGGMLLDWGVHIIDQLLWLYPEKIKRVAADFSTVLGEKVDDGFTATFWFEDGLKTTVEVGTTNLISLARWYVLGTQGTAMITNFGSEGEMAISTGARNTNPVPVQAGVGLTKTMAPLSEEQMLVRELPEPEKMSQSFYRNLYAVLRNDATPVVKNSEVLRVLKLIATVSEAAATHQILPFE